MSKIIHMTSEYYDMLRSEFEELLMSGKFSNGKVEFSKSFSDTKQKATVYFREAAWYKMQSLIQDFEKEVAWHGTVERGNDPEKHEFIITDILVYPQIVTGTTADTDQIQYQTWLYSLDDDIFNALRFQGHSHVNMATSPSSVDTSHQEEILKQIEGDMFYIFGIFNKRGEFNIRIYDYAVNTFFESSDITIKVLDGDFGLEKFLSEAHELVVEKKFTSPTVSASGSSKVISTGITSGTSAQSSGNKIPVASGSEKNDDSKSTKGKRKKKTDTKSSSSVSPYNAYCYDDEWYGYPNWS